MNKLEDLRTHLLTWIEELKKSPENLLTFADKGKIVCNSLTLSFEYQYIANVILTDFAGDTDKVMVVLLAWYQQHQQDKCFSTNIEFEADILNNKTVDLSLKLELTERVIVTKNDQGQIVSLIHPPEPILDTETFAWPADLFINGEPSA